MKNPVRLALAALIGLALSATPSPAEAGPVVWAFTGHVEFVDSPASAYFPLLGTDFSGWFTFDSDAVDQSASPQLGRYATSSWTINLPGLASTWSYSGGSIEVARNDFVGGPFYPCPGGCLVASAGGTVTSDNAAAPPPIGRFEFRIFDGDYPNDSLMAVPPAAIAAGFAFDFPVTPVSGSLNVRNVASVPEPVTMILVGAGVAAGLVARRRRNRDRNRPHETVR